MRVDLSPRHKNAGRPAHKSAPAFLGWIRKRRCHLESKGGCGGRIRACHVDYAGDKGMGTKVSDRHSIPMCDAHHGEQHRIGWPAFEAKYGFRAYDDAGEFWRLWPQRRKWEADNEQ